MAVQFIDYMYLLGIGLIIFRIMILIIALWNGDGTLEFKHEEKEAKKQVISYLKFTEMLAGEARI